MFKPASSLARTTKAAVAAVCIFAHLATPAAAGVQSEMQNFMNDLGNFANVTGPGAHTGQEAGFYTGGNVFMRIPQRNTQLAALQMPGFRAGCGGIDVFAGAFSFINAGQLIQMMKSIASSAVGFSFKLALETISPVIAETLGELNDLAQRINQANINSCEAAQALVGQVWSRTDLGTGALCSVFGNSAGIFSDYAEAKNNCGSGGQRTSTINSATGFEKAFVPYNKNLSWEAIKNNVYLNSLTTEEKELWMTLAGTVILRRQNNDDNPTLVNQSSPKADDPAYIQALMGAGDMQLVVHSCGSDTTDCLDMQPFAKTITLSESSTFRGRVRDMLTQMVNNILTDTPLTEEQRGILNMTPLPAYKFLNVYTTYSQQMALAEIPKMSDIVALDVVTAWVGQGLREVEKAAAQVQGVDWNMREEWLGKINKAKENLARMRDSASASVANDIAYIERTRVIEGILNSRFSDTVGGSIGFAKALKRGL
ncbi:MAG: conjugal transfer protein TraH [Alphaproteobacteria bacterium]|nr:conjugal transfer protein TraH [Alphaproteobacteria bacterium]